jgi:hypothetical protein
VTLLARWVMLRARWVTLRARWVTLRARWVTPRARWVTLRSLLGERSELVSAAGVCRVGECVRAACYVAHCLAELHDDPLLLELLSVAAEADPGEANQSNMSPRMPWPIDTDTVY